MPPTTPLTDSATVAPRRRKLRPFVLFSVLALAVLCGWAFWPAGPQASPYDLSRADGKPRFFRTDCFKVVMPPNFPLLQRLHWNWQEYRRRHGKPNLATYSFPPFSNQLFSIQGMLNQCTEVSGTRYLIAVEIAGTVNFGSTNTLSGSKWTAAVEHTLETTDKVLCYDYARTRNFQDSLLLIRESPGEVKIVPRTKLAAYQSAGLIKKEPR